MTTVAPGVCPLDGLPPEHDWHDPRPGGADWPRFDHGQLLAAYWQGRAEERQVVRRRRFWRRFWDVVTIIVCGVMLFAAGYLLGHAHIHEVVVYRAPVTVE